MIHNEVEVYVDDMIIKFPDISHILALWVFFERLHHFEIRLNPQKRVFGVTKGKMLGYMVSKKGIKVYLTKVK